MEVTDQINAKISRVTVIMHRFRTRREKPGDFTEALEIIRYLQELAEAAGNTGDKVAITRFLRRWRNRVANI